MRRSFLSLRCLWMMAWLSSLLAIGGCGGASHGENTEEDGDTGAPSCIALDADCPTGMTCDSSLGQCVVKPTCNLQQGVECATDVQCQLDGNTNRFCMEPQCECVDYVADGDVETDKEHDGDSNTDSSGCTANDPRIQVDPAALSFGLVQIGSTMSLTAHLTNSGGGTLIIYTPQWSTGSSKDFSFKDQVPSSIKLGAGESYELVVKYTPSGGMNYQGTIQMTTNSCPNDNPVTTLVASAEIKGDTQIVVAPTFYDFGQIPLNQSTPLAVQIKNSVPWDCSPSNPDVTKPCNRPLRILGLKFGSSNSESATNFTIDSNLPWDDSHMIYIKPDESISVTVDFDPRVADAITDALFISHDATKNDYSESGTVSDPVKVTLTGTGAIPTLQLTPATLNFGPIPINQGTPKVLRLKDTGGATLQISSIAWSGNTSAQTRSECQVQAGSNYPITIPSGDSVYITVTCTPTHTGYSDTNAQLDIASNDMMSPTQHVSVAYQGVTATLEFNPSELSFTDTLVGASAIASVNVHNLGTIDVTILPTSAMSQEGTNNGFSFLAAQSNFDPLNGLKVLAGNTQPLYFQFYPQSIPASTATELFGQFSIVTDNSAANAIIKLEGRPLWPLCKFEVTEDPNFAGTIDFGEVPVGSRAVRHLHITNDGTYPCNILNDPLSLGSSPDAAFSLYGNNVLPVAPGSAQDVEITCAPVETHHSTGMITIETNDLRPSYSSYSVSLSCQGVYPLFNVDPDSTQTTRVTYLNALNQNPLLSGCSVPKTYKITNIGTGTLNVCRPKDITSGWTQISNLPSWTMSEWQAPHNPSESSGNYCYALESIQSNPDAAITFDVTFCPKNLPLTQKADYALTVNDPRFTVKKLYMQGTGATCPTDYYDLDGNPDNGCEYYCYRPTAASRVPYEICDGYDNNCDGRIDEDFPVISKCTRPNGTTIAGCEATVACRGLGECGAGVNVCTGNFTYSCSTMPGVPGYVSQASPELCDGKDNDCDGHTDEDYGVGQLCAGIGECRIGHIVCDPKDSTQHSTYCDANDDGTSEVCDYKDNNCDGLTDNAAFYIQVSADKPCDQVVCATSGDATHVVVGTTCTGSGTCTRYGYWECVRNRTDSIECSSNSVGGTVELCDNRDNNCNGDVDEGFNIGAVCKGKGECGAGTLECNPLDPNKGSTICSTDIGGSANHGPNGSKTETCNGKDDDCDGIIDNNVLSKTGQVVNVGDACIAPGACGAGYWKCDPSGSGRAVCSSGPDGGSTSQVQPEICDGKDNNCDGRTDEGIADINGVTHNVGDPCDGVGECGAGHYVCNGTDLVKCSSDNSGTAEICDGLDNNCDGIVDNGILAEDDHLAHTVGDTCTAPGICGTGKYECKNAGMLRCSSMVNATFEVCDGLDNDCNGIVDDGIPDINGALHKVGDVCKGIGECGYGHYECNPNNSHVLLCSTDIGGSENSGPNGSKPEVCDGKDNDCDGQIDNGWFGNTGGVNDDVNNCGACGVSCYTKIPLSGANGVPYCEKGSCKIQCNDGYYDNDGAISDGCECQMKNETHGNTCADAVDLGNISEGSAVTRVTQYNLYATSDVDWFKFTALDAPDNGSDTYHVDVRLTGDNASYFSFAVFMDNCADTGRQFDTCNTYDFRTDSQFPELAGPDEPAWGPGQGPCYGEHTSTSNTSVPYMNTCDQINHVFYIKVFSLGVSNCANYTLEVSNGFYHTDASTK